jgi:hypothetical protein
MVDSEYAARSVNTTPCATDGTATGGTTLDGDARTPANRDEVLQLCGHDLGTADEAVQRQLVDQFHIGRIPAAAGGTTC